MYNRYIGNTGKFYRVNDDELPVRDDHQFTPQPAPIHAAEQPPQNTPHIRSAVSAHSYSPPDLTVSLKKLLSGILPVGMDIGDLLLILVLLLLYLEKEDEEILIILSVLIFMGFK